MKLNQQGFIGTFLIIFVVVLIALFYFQNAEKEKIFNTWAKACEDKGGFIQQTRANWFDCIIDGETVVLPGYEEYQKDKPL